MGRCVEFGVEQAGALESYIVANGLKAASARNEEEKEEEEESRKAVGARSR